MIAVTEHGRGRVAVLGRLRPVRRRLPRRARPPRALAGARQLGRAAPRGRARRPTAAAEQRPAWQTLREHTDALALLQAPDGALAADAGARPRAPRRGDRRRARRARRRSSRTRRDYLEAVARRPRALDRRPRTSARTSPPRSSASAPTSSAATASSTWSCSRCTSRTARGTPASRRSSSATPWPDWIAELEATRYDNPKFVPVQLVAGTRGYESECAVLFPETVATAERPPNHFGAIFCDREAERLARVAGAAAELTSLNLPAEAVKLLDSPPLLEEAYILWDLIHDRAHSHGDLPFDPFMIRQRAPYWMYSLEELRCDLTAFTQALELEAGGLAGPARRVQYAILLDRLLRFPITGERDAQLRRPRRAAAVRLPAPPRAACTGPTTGCGSTGRAVADGVRGAPRARSRRCTARGSTGRSSATGRPRTT